MKNLLKIILIDILVFSVLAFVVTSLTLNEHCGASVPDIPNAFRGYANYGGSAQASKTVTATLDGVDFSTTTDSSGYYALDVSRCGNSSATEITFIVCTRSASETASFVSSTVTPTMLNLTISEACPTVTTPLGGGGGGGGAAGGGGGGAAVPSKIDLDIKPTATTVGYTARQTQGDTATFTVAGTQYTAELTQLRSDSVTITVAGQSTILNIGDVAEFDVNGDGVNDISVTLAAIEGGRAEIVYKLLAKVEEKPEEILPPEVKLPGEIKPPEEVIPAPTKGRGWVVAAIIVVIGALVYIGVRKKKGQEGPV